MTEKEERLHFKTERLTRLRCPYDSLDVRETVMFGIEFAYDADEIIALAERYSGDTGLPMDEIDLVYVVYEYVLQKAKHRIYEATGYNFLNDSSGEIYTYSNCIATTYVMNQGRA